MQSEWTFRSDRCAFVRLYFNFGSPRLALFLFLLSFDIAEYTYEVYIYISLLCTLVLPGNQLISLPGVSPLFPLEDSFRCRL